MLAESTYNSFSSIFCLSPCLLVRLEPVLGQLAARYHYLLDSGQSYLPACSCFIELDKYNMWLTAIIYYRTALFIQQAEALVHSNWPLSLWWNYTQVMEAFERPFMGFEPVEKLTTWIKSFTWINCETKTLNQSVYWYLKSNHRSGRTLEKVL